MIKQDAKAMEEVMNRQRNLWEGMFSNESDVYGLGPSCSACKAAGLFKKEGKTRILELGCGQGRDALFFAQCGFQVYVLDYCKSVIDALNQKARSVGLSSSLRVICHDVRTPLPFEDESFDGCYSHILHCCLTLVLSECLFAEIRRVLKVGGINVSTVRSIEDPSYGTGVQRGTDLYEVDGFLMQFFTREEMVQLAKGFEIVQLEEMDEDPPHQNVLRGIFRKIGKFEHGQISRVLMGI